MAHSVREIMNAIRWKWAALFFFMPSYFVRHFTAFNDITHLSIRTNYLKHKGSQLLTPFSSIVFHVRSYSVIHFVPTPIAPIFTVSKAKGTKWIASCEKAWKTMLGNEASSYVHSCLSTLLLLERCKRITFFFKSINLKN